MSHHTANRKHVAHSETLLKLYIAQEKFYTLVMVYRWSFYDYRCHINAEDKGNSIKTFT